MRRTLAAAVLALAAVAVATPASAGPDPLQIVKDTLGECMDCVPGRCDILWSCELDDTVGEVIPLP